MTISKKFYKTLGSELMEFLRKNFDVVNSTVRNKKHEYQRIDLASEFNVRFCMWGNSPYYIILFLKDRYLFEFDLTRIVEESGKFTWYLNRPTHEKNRTLLNQQLEWVDEAPTSYVGAVRQIKNQLHAGTIIRKASFRLCDKVDRKIMEERFGDIVQKAIGAHLEDVNSKGTQAVEFDLDDPKAFEGYEKDRIITTYYRNQSIIKQCKERDNYSCRVCHFQLKIHGQYVIECHHLDLLSQNGVRLSSIDKLVCLCPTCHRIAHKRSTPFSINEIQKLRVGFASALTRKHSEKIWNKKKEGSLVSEE